MALGGFAKSRASIPLTAIYQKCELAGVWAALRKAWPALHCSRHKRALSNFILIVIEYFTPQLSFPVRAIASQVDHTTSTDDVQTCRRVCKALIGVARRYEPQLRLVSKMQNSKKTTATCSSLLDISLLIWSIMCCQPRRCSSGRHVK